MPDHVMRHPWSTPGHPLKAHQAAPNHVRWGIWGTCPRRATTAIQVREEDFAELGAVSVQDAIAVFTDDGLLGRFVERYGPAATVALLSNNANRVGVDCHQRAHDMGRIAYELFGTQAFSLAGHECHSGGYHGATEAFFRDRGTATLDEDIGIVCGGHLNSFFRHQCVHGVGHGLMAWTSYEIFDALELCDNLPTSADQGSCYSGVFVENVVGGLAGSMGHYTEYLSEDPHYPCNILEDRHLASCYFFQTSRMVQLFGGDFEKVAQACADAPESAHHLCFHSMGRDVGGVSRGRPDQAIQLCSHAAKAADRIQCLDGAVQDSFWDAGGADDALAFCGKLTEEQEKQSCYSTVKNRAHSIYGGPGDLAAFCDLIPAQYRDGCP